MKLHCIDDIVNGQQAFMPSGLIATLTVCPDEKTVLLQYPHELDVIEDTLTFDEFEKLIQDGIDIIRDDTPMPLRVSESHETLGRKQQIVTAANAEGVSLDNVFITSAGIEVSGDIPIAEKILKLAELEDLMDRYGIDYNVYYEKLKTPDGVIRVPHIGFNTTWLESNLKEELFSGEQVELDIPTEFIDTIAVSGDNELAVEDALKNEGIRTQLEKYTDEQLLKEIEGYGVDFDEEQKKDRHTLEKYIVWLFAWNIADGPERIEESLNEDDVQDEIDSEINDVFSVDELKQGAREWLNDYTLDILDHLDGFAINDIVTEQAAKFGWMTYGGDSHDVVINVKGRPNLPFDGEDLGIDSDLFYEELQFLIDEFFDLMQEQYPNLVVHGARDGYWGLSCNRSDLAISDKFVDSYVERIMDDYEFISFAITSEWKSAYDYINAYYQWDYIWLENLSDLLLEDDEYIEFSKEFKDSMNGLVAAIDAQEKYWQDMNNWKEYFELNNEVNEDDYE